MPVQLRQQVLMQLRQQLIVHLSEQLLSAMHFYIQLLLSPWQKST